MVDLKSAFLKKGGEFASVFFHAVKIKKIRADRNYRCLRMPDYSQRKSETARTSL
jgi:hypothetical protein